ncbi:SLAM family member 5 [Danio aesculapii]|uniref:SLAM family member 5 n=1 Tax=Danio aesculapii TaxID=1142201 RepID=UPI0024BF3931|nr:SLAM family member 5 [Danio aesculapii]
MMLVFIVFFLCLKDLVNAEWDEVKTVMEGHILTLHAGSAQMEGHSEIIWYFKSAGRTTRIAQMNRGGVVNVYEESLAHRLKLDRTCGSLTICNISISDSGVYEVSQTIKLHVYEKKFRVDVYAPVSVPAIERNSLVIEHRSSGTLKQPQELCSVLCSVKNSRDVLISWHKGGEMIKQSSSPELNISLSLSLELHYEDVENYRCTAENPVSNKSIQLQLRDVCRSTQKDCQDHCGATLIRLVLSGLVGIATVLFLFDHLRLRSAQDRDAAVSVC